MLGEMEGRRGKEKKEKQWTKIPTPDDEGTFCTFLGFGVGLEWEERVEGEEEGAGRRGGEEKKEAVCGGCSVCGWEAGLMFSCPTYHHHHHNLPACPAVLCLPSSVLCFSCLLFPSLDHLGGCLTCQPSYTRCQTVFFYLPFNTMSSLLSLPL